MATSLGTLLFPKKGLILIVSPDFHHDKLRLQLLNNEEKHNEDPTGYRRLIGSLCYLCNTYLDLTFSVGIASRFMKRSELSHLTAAKRFLRYIKGSIGCGILFSAVVTGRKCNLLSFTDFNWCEDKDDQKSTVEYIFMFGETPISWCSKKELVVALSPYEVEYIVASLCACQIVWLMNLLKELSSSEGETFTLLVNNVSAINLGKNLIAHGRSKHIETRFHYLREFVNEEKLRLKYCRSEDRVDDFFTKRLANDVFKRLKMSMKDLEHLNEVCVLREN